MSEVICKRCGTETNEPPPEYPPEWNGHCPACAVILSLQGELPPSPHTADLIIHGLMTAIASGRLVKLGDNDEVLSENDQAMIVAHRICLN